MKIRKINRSDYNQIAEIMQTFARESGILGNSRPEYNIEHGKKLLLKCELSGVSLCAQDSQGQIQGILLSTKVKDIWIPEVTRLFELVWYVKPAHRGGTIAGRLFYEYKKQAEAMRQAGEISSYTIGVSRLTSDINFAPRGFKHFESVYMIGE